MTTALDLWRQQKDDFFKRHPQSPIPLSQRAAFTGLTYYPANPALDLTLEAEEFSRKEQILMQTSTGDVRPYLRWGQVHFQVDGSPATLTIYYSEELDHFFLPFMDATSGSETYGAGRYLDPELVRPKSFHLDFNRAYFPFCAYNPAYSCPIPPQENRLKVRIEAGEKLPPEGQLSQDYPKHLGI